MAQNTSRRARWIVIAMMALMGAAFFYEFFTADMAHASAAESPEIAPGLVVRYILAMAVGGAIAGAVTAGLFGRAGAGGWLLAALGLIAATLLAGLLGSAIGLTPDLLADGFSMKDVISIGFGLVLIPLSFAGRPYLFAFWLVIALATHLLARRARQASSAPLD